MFDTSAGSQQNFTSEGVPNLAFQYHYQNVVIQQLNVICNSISIACAMIVLIITASLRIYDKKLVDRVSLRLNAAVSATDVVNSMALLIYTFSNSEGGSCKFSAFLIIWLSNQYIFLTTAIAFNLQWLFLHKRSLGSNEKWYFICSIGFALLTAIIPLAAGKLGYDIAQTYCWYTPSYTAQTQGFEWGTYIGPQLICLTYCLVVVVIVAIKLKRDKRKLDRQLRSPWMGKEWEQHPSYQAEARQRKAQRSINRVVRRILLYPLVPIITQTGFIVSEIWMYQNLEASFALNIWGVSLKALPGFFNLIAFSVDPAVYNVGVTLINDLVDKYGDVPKSSSTKGSAGALRRPFDPTVTDMSLFQEPGNSQAESTCVEPQIHKNKFMQWIVQKWLQPTAGKRDSLIQVSSSDDPETRDEEAALQFDYSKPQPNEVPEIDDHITPLPMAWTPTEQSNISEISAKTTRPLSQGSLHYTAPSSVPSQNSSSRTRSSVIMDTLSPHSRATGGSSTLHYSSTPTSDASPHRHRRRHTNAGREMFHAL